MLPLSCLETAAERGVKAPLASGGISKSWVGNASCPPSFLCSGELLNFIIYIDFFWCRSAGFGHRCLYFVRNGVSVPTSSVLAADGLVLAEFSTAGMSQSCVSLWFSHSAPHMVLLVAPQVAPGTGAVQVFLFHQLCGVVEELFGFGGPDGLGGDESGGLEDWVWGLILEQEL